MCKLTELQHNIHSITKDGYDIAAFLADTMRGETPGVKVNHRMDAAKQLIKYGFTDTDCETTSDRLSRAGGNPEEQGGDETPVQSPLSPGERVRVRGKEIAAPVTHLDIINYQIAHLIRHETAEGHTVVNFLVDIMTGRDRPFTPKKFCIKPADRMAAARELLRRGFGDIGTSRKQSDSTDEANAYDTLHTDLAQRMREYSERGADTIRFLLEVMSDPNPEEEFTIHHRLSAAQELLRRGWDTNYDNIKHEHLQDYWRDKESPRLSIGQKKTQAGLPTSIDDYDNTDYEAIARQLREDEDREDASKPLESRAGGNPEEQGGDETPVQSPLSPGERARVRGKEIAAPVTHLDITNYQIAHLIRHETAEGHTVVEFLIHIMSGRDRPFTPKKFRIKPADRMAAARELLRRGFGDFGSRRKLSDTSDEANAYDTLHTDLARRMREYSERGTDTIRFLLELMSDPDPDKEFTVHHRMYAAQELLRRGWDTNYDNIKPEHLQAYWKDKESPRLSIGQKKTQAGLSTTIDDYDNYDAVDYEAIAKEMKEEEDRQAAANEPKRRTIAPSPSTGEGWDGGEKSPTSKSDNTPSTPTLPKSLPLSKSGDDPTAERKSIIREFREAMDRGDERAALRAEAKYRRIDVKPEKNIYDYGPNDPDPTVDYYFEPLNSEEQAKFDKEDRREHGLTEEEIAEYSAISTPEAKSDPLKKLADAAATHNTPIHPNPLAAKRKNPTIRSP